MMLELEATVTGIEFDFHHHKTHEDQITTPKHENTTNEFDQQTMQSITSNRITKDCTRNFNN